MQLDIPDFVQDMNRSFIVVGLYKCNLDDRLRLLPISFWYCLAHDYDMMIYWEKEPTYMPGIYSEILAAVDLVQNTWKLRAGLQKIESINVHVWEQPKWDA